VIEIDEASVRRLENNELLPYRGRSLPLLRLRRLFGPGGDAPPRPHAFVVGTGQDAVALGVDRVLGQREIVVRAIPDDLVRVDGVAGATELGDGRVVLILDAVALARLPRHGRHRRRSAGPATGPHTPTPIDGARA
jgi:two-component system chemotaxis sensor kinase CheA